MTRIVNYGGRSKTVYDEVTATTKCVMPRSSSRAASISNSTFDDIDINGENPTLDARDDVPT